MFWSLCFFVVVNGLKNKCVEKVKKDDVKNKQNKIGNTERFFVVFGTCKKKEKKSKKEKSMKFFMSEIYAHEAMSFEACFGPGNGQGNVEAQTKI